MTHVSVKQKGTLDGQVKVSNLVRKRIYSKTQISRAPLGRGARASPSETNEGVSKLCAKIYDTLVSNKFFRTFAIGMVVKGE